MNITLFNQIEYYLEFYLALNKNQKYKLKLNTIHYGLKKLKNESTEFKALDNYTFTYLSRIFEKINELYKS